MRAHELISEQWDTGGGAWNPEKSKIDITFKFLTKKQQKRNIYKEMLAISVKLD